MFIYSCVSNVRFCCFSIFGFQLLKWTVWRRHIWLWHNVMSKCNFIVFRFFFLIHQIFNYLFEKNGEINWKCKYLVVTALTNVFSRVDHFLLLSSAQTVGAGHRHQPQQAGASLLLVQRVRGLSGERPAGGAEPCGDKEHRLQLHPGRPRRPGGGALQPRHAARLLRHPAYVLRAVAHLHTSARLAPEHPVGLQEPDATCQPVPWGGWRAGIRHWGCLLLWLVISVSFCASLVFHLFHCFVSLCGYFVSFLLVSVVALDVFVVILCLVILCDHFVSLQLFYISFVLFCTCFASLWTCCWSLFSLSLLFVVLIYLFLLSF